jgi:ATP-dependent DNA helicase RecQ
MTALKSKHPPEGHATPWRDLRAQALRRFGIRHFRPGQKQILEAIFAGRDVVGIMPTGAGKSLCYQLPSLFMPRPVLVVSPLISLMHDQQEKAREASIAVEKIDSTLTQSEQREAEEQIGEGAPQLVYVTPERLENAEFLDTLRATGVSLMVIDEAHCISQWGMDFRPAYLNLSGARERLGHPQVMALTATATDAVLKDITARLHAPDAVIVSTGIERENLAFSVEPTVNIDAKQQRVLDLIRQTEGTSIVYTASVKSANALLDLLHEHEVPAAQYHGRMRKQAREQAQQQFMDNQVRVLIATKAFGMGIDKPDIRGVFHYEFPDSLESYYQEAGRAGRDGLPARAVLLYRLEDRRIQTFFLAGRYPRHPELRSVLHAVREAAQVPVIAEKSGVSRRRVQVILYLMGEAGLVRRTARGYAPIARPVNDVELDELAAAFEQRSIQDRERLAEMIHYAESPKCRKQLLRAYFSEPEGEPCGECDNCRNPKDRAAQPAAQSATGTPHVTEVATAIGTTIATTAPETLPSKEAPPFTAGDSVRHRRFGRGKVLDVGGGSALIRFEKQGMKRVRLDYLTRAQ